MSMIIKGRFMKKKKTQRIKSELRRIFALAVVVLSICCAFIYLSVQRILITNENEYLLVSSQRLLNRLNYMYDRLESISVSLSADEQLQDFLVADISDKAGFVNYAEVLLTQFRILEPDILDIALVSDNMHYSSVYNDEELDEICEDMDDSSFQWTGIRTSSFVSLQNKEPMFLYGNNIIKAGEKAGTLLISVGASYFLGELDSMPFGYALSGKETLYKLNPEEIDEEVWNQWFNIQKETELSKYGDYYIQAVYMEKMNCYLISAYSTAVKYASSNMLFLQVLIWSCILAVVVFLTLIMFLVNKRLVKPLQTFYNSIREIRDCRQRYLKQRIELDGCLEIREIGNEFSDMMQGIENLNKTIFENTTHLYELELERQKAELSYLRGQIDPHFLYNTLEAMREQALIKDAPELAQMAVDMGRIFRYSSKGEPLVFLREEVEIIKSYVRIQENRFQGRLKVFYMISEDLMEQKIMKMLLQPLIENAVYHGIEPKTGKGAIFIGARREENDLILTVKDNGVGIPGERLEEIRRELLADTFDTSRHVGILNTQARIKLTHGKQYGLEIESSESDGTSIRIIVPAIEGGKTDVSGIDCR